MRGGPLNKERIDKILVDRGLAGSRTKAQAMIMAGIVLVNERRIEKPSETVLETDVVRIKEVSGVMKYVGRGGLKLEKALAEFHICPNAYVCLDIGSSTGGFTDCLLQQGAASVTAIDAGTNQLAWKLRNDPRVQVRENTNARDLRPQDFPKRFDLAVMDVSFISATKVLPAIVPLLAPLGRIIVLIKPQFEAGRAEVGKGGIIKDPAVHRRVVEEVNSFAVGLGLTVAGTMESPILGAEGNKEFLSLYEAGK